MKLLFLQLFLMSCVCKKIEDTIIELDSYIFQAVSSPDILYKDSLRDNISELYMSIDEVFDNIKKGLEESRTIAKNIMEQGGLMIQNIVPNDTLVRHTYNWTKDSDKEIREAIGGISLMWRRIRASVEHPIPAYFAEVSPPDEVDPPPGCGVYHQNFTITPQWQKLFSAGRNLTLFYKNPTSGRDTGHEMITTAAIFLEELEKLDNEFTVENRVPATDAAWELYICGGPLHIRQIPYGEFVRLFNWNSTDLDKYSTIIDNTRRIWSNIVEELKRIAPTDIII